MVGREAADLYTYKWLKWYILGAMYFTTIKFLKMAHTKKTGAREEKWNEEHIMLTGQMCP